MRAVLLWFLVACGSQDPHADGTCDPGWVNNGFDSCELACEDSGVALGASGPACNAVTVDRATVSCSKTFDFEGVRGCCSVNDTEVHFAECQ